MFDNHEGRDMRKEIFWALWSPSAGFISIVETTRSKLIEAAINNYDCTWAELRKIGFRAKKVELVEVK